jgi:hypothetical protein
MSKLRTMRAYILFYFFQEVRYKLEKRETENELYLEDIGANTSFGWMDGWMGE